MRDHNNFDSEVALRRIARIQEILRREPSTAQEVADAIQMTVRWARDYLVHLVAQRQAHVADYRRVKVNTLNRNVALYGWGPRP
jgi:predicted ArsR family transcriptional regulator